MSKILVTGVGEKRSLGHRIAQCLTDDKHEVIALSRHPLGDRDYVSYAADLRGSLQVQWLPTIIKDIEIVVNCAGVNRLDYLQDLSLADWDESFEVNVRAPMLVVRAFLPDLIRVGGTVLNIGSSAAHVPMTASIAYNSSKAALDMMTRQMARELGRRHRICVFGINPNKLSDTPMSDEVDINVRRVRGWTREYAEDYQKQSLPQGRETDPNRLAEYIAFLLSSRERHLHLAGCMIPFGTQTL